MDHTRPSPGAPNRKVVVILVAIAASALLLVGVLAMKVGSSVAPKSVHAELEEHERFLAEQPGSGRDREGYERVEKALQELVKRTEANSDEETRARSLLAKVRVRLGR